MSTVMLAPAPLFVATIPDPEDAVEVVVTGQPGPPGAPGNPGPPGPPGSINDLDFGDITLIFDNKLV